MCPGVPRPVDQRRPIMVFLLGLKLWSLEASVQILLGGQQWVLLLNCVWRWDASKGGQHRLRGSFGSWALIQQKFWWASYVSSVLWGLCPYSINTSIVGPVTETNPDHVTLSQKTQRLKCRVRFVLSWHRAQDYRAYFQEASFQPLNWEQLRLGQKGTLA